jgi:addiction module HigA family antidote
MPRHPERKPVDTIHPGRFVRTRIVEPYGLSVTEASRVLGITRAALSAFLNEHSALSPEMAIRIEKAFGVSLEELMQMQTSYDIALAQGRKGEIEVEPFRQKPLDSQAS